VRPHTFRQERVCAGDVDRHSSDATVDALDGLDRFLNKRAVDPRCNETIADGQQLRRAESPRLGTSHEKRMLEGCFDSTVDDVEAVVLADAKLRDATRSHAGAFESPRREPFVLRLERHIRLEAGHEQRLHHVAGPQHFDRHAPAVFKRDERAVKEAVARSGT